MKQRNQTHNVFAGAFGGAAVSTPAANPVDPFQQYIASHEADVNIDIDVNEGEEETAPIEEAIDTSETPEASELEVQDAESAVDTEDQASDNVDEAVTSLESLYITLDTIASTESTMSDSTFALFQLHANTIGARIGATAGMLVPSVESDDLFTRNDIEASMEAILDRIKEGTKSFGAMIRNQYQKVVDYVKTLRSHHDRTAKRLEAVKAKLEGGALGDAVSVSGRVGKRLAQGEQIADPATILKGAADLGKLATQVLNDRKGIQIYASAASMLAKDGGIDEARISAELQKAYPALKVAADENGNVPLMIGNTALFLTKGKGEADGLVRLGFKNGAAKVTGQRGFKAAAKAGAAKGKEISDKILDSKASKFVGKTVRGVGTAMGAVTGAAAAGGASRVTGLASLGGATMANAFVDGAQDVGRFAANTGAKAAGAIAGGAVNGGRFDVTPLNEAQAKQFIDAAEALIAIVTKYESDIEARNATNEQIAKLLDEATSGGEGDGDVSKEQLKANASLRRALGKSWKKTLKTETKVSSWVLNTAGALLSYVGGQVGVKEEAEEAPEGATGGDE